MNEKPPSTNGSGRTGVFKRVIRAIKGDPLSRDEIQNLLQEDESVFEPEEKEMLSNVLEVAETQVRDVMIPRSQMVVIELGHSLDEMLSVILSSGHSRFPVIGEDRDEVLGILLAKDLLRFFGDATDTELDIEDYLRPVTVIPESKRLNALLKEFRDSRSHMAIVVDEYGGTAGLVTLEDILEELIGDIQDEFDQEVPKVQTQPDGRLMLDAALTIAELETFTGAHEDIVEHVDTIGGLIQARLGRLARIGDAIPFGGRTLEVVRVKGRRILRVAVSQPQASAESQ